MVVCVRLVEDTLRLVGVAAPAADFEAEDLDFKRVATDPRKTLELLADAAVCFANASGGTLVLGVDDKATARSDALIGVDADLTLNAIRKGIFVILAHSSVRDMSSFLVIAAILKHRAPAISCCRPTLSFWL